MRLADGTIVRLRPIHPDDRAKLTAMGERLSPESYRRRFFSPAPLSDSMLSSFLEVDYRRHFAFVATVENQGEEPIVATGRYIRSKTDRSRAEIALTVIDDYQGRGIGTVLFAALAVVARANDIETFEGLVLTENAAMLSILRHAEPSLDQSEPGVLRAVMDIPDSPGRVSGRALRIAVRSAPIWQGRPA
jgi:GNAT superfamily N-acetyltransferase